jgi:protein-disulfide isomerase
MAKWWRAVAVLLVGIGVGLGVSQLRRAPAIETSKNPTASTKAVIQAPSPTVPTDPARVVYRVPVDDSPIRGPDDALVTIVESSDFQCPFCKRVGPTVEQIRSTYAGKVRFVFKHNPLSFHDKARLAAVAAEQARVQGGNGKFWEMHDQLFAISPALERPNLEAAAAKIGLDPVAFRAGLDSGRHDARIERDQTLVTGLGAGVTPAFFINGRLLSGAQPFERFQSLIDEELVKAEALVKSGVAPRELYARIIEKGATRAVAAPTAPAPAAPTAALVPLRPDDPVRGQKAAKVTIALFSDFQCPFCARVEPTLKQVSETYGKDVRIVWKHRPLSFHPSAMPAAIAAEAAREQGKFWRMHDALFAAQAELGPARYEVLAKQLGMDVGRFKASIEKHGGLPRIQEDIKLADSVGATGTPTLFVNCRPLVGAKPFAEFKTLIDQEVEKASEMVNAGTRVDGGFYDKICERNAEAAVAGGGGARPTVDVPLRPDDPSRGNAKAAVTIITFSDFQCPFCARAEPTLAEVARAYGDKVRFVWKHQPLAMHPQAMSAALAAEAAREQGKFWEMHDRLFQNQASLSSETYDRLAGELGLDLGRFHQSMSDPRAQTRIQEDQSLGWKVGAGGTPTFFINGEQVVGAVPFEQLKAAIDRQLSRLARR